jgi:bifunctional UDP-N-acetylglucosamine pyrophosphorylase/glucosamine-1-phosphate N-acetyltransferase
MIERVVRAAKAAGASDIRVIVGFGENLVRQIVEPLGAHGFKQERQLGTADAVRSAKVDDLEGDVVILNGDHPLLEASDISQFRTEFNDRKASVAVVTCELKLPGAFGRIVYQHGKVRAIVEAKDASHETLKIKEVNTGIYIVKADILREFLPRIESQNAQGEYYLTDLIELAVEEGLAVEGIRANARVALGVNTQAELASATRKAFLRKAQRLMEGGVILLQPQTTFVEDTVTVAAGAILYPNVHLRGDTNIGALSCIESGVMINNSVVGENVHVKAGSYLDSAKVGSRVDLGPYAHLRPGTEIGDECKVGNFVEMKKVKFGKGAKASHLTYLGDAEVGENTNIGCGTITCNYAADHKKYFTKIGRDVFVGSDSQLVAPVTVGDGAVIGSGSTITKDVPARSLAVARAKQFVKENYVPRSPSTPKKDS